jgi:hypothetical protein
VSTEQNPYAPPRVDLAALPPPAEAVVTAGPRGIGGWLVLPLLRMLLLPVHTVLELRDLSWALQPEMWAAITTPGTDTYHPLWGPTVIYEVVTLVGFQLFTVLVLVLFIRKDRRVPRVMTIWLALPVLLLVIDMVLLGQIPVRAASDQGPRAVELVMTLVAAAIWIPYFWLSVRVKNTFVK